MNVIVFLNEKACWIVKMRVQGILFSSVPMNTETPHMADMCPSILDLLGVSHDIVNVNGGAIALGHPLGCTGAKLTATLLHEMKRRGVRYGGVSRCVGGGMGAAALFEVA